MVVHAMRGRDLCGSTRVAGPSCLACEVEGVWRLLLSWDPRRHLGTDIYLGIVSLLGGDGISILLRLGGEGAFCRRRFYPSSRRVAEPSEDTSGGASCSHLQRRGADGRMDFPSHCPGLGGGDMQHDGRRDTHHRTGGGRRWWQTTAEDSGGDHRPQPHLPSPPSSLLTALLNSQHHTLKVSAMGKFLGETREKTLIIFGGSGGGQWRRRTAAGGFMR